MSLYCSRGRKESSWYSRQARNSRKTSTLTRKGKSDFQPWQNPKNRSKPSELKGFYLFSLISSLATLTPNYAPDSSVHRAETQRNSEKLAVTSGRVVFSREVRAWNEFGSIMLCGSEEQLFLSLSDQLLLALENPSKWLMFTRRLTNIRNWSRRWYDWGRPTTTELKSTIGED